MKKDFHRPDFISVISIVCCSLHFAKQWTCRRGQIQCSGRGSGHLGKISGTSRCRRGRARATHGRTRRGRERAGDGPVRRSPLFFGSESRKHLIPRPRARRMRTPEHSLEDKGRGRNVIACSPCVARKEQLSMSTWMLGGFEVRIRVSLPCPKHPEPR